MSASFQVKSFDVQDFTWEGVVVLSFKQQADNPQTYRPSLTIHRV